MKTLGVDITLDEFFGNMRGIPAGVIFPNIKARDAMIPSRSARRFEPIDALIGLRVMVNHYLPPDSLAFVDRDGQLLGIVFGIQVPS